MVSATTFPCARERKRATGDEENDRGFAGARNSADGLSSPALRSRWENEGVPMLTHTSEVAFMRMCGPSSMVLLAMKLARALLGSSPSNRFRLLDAHDADDRRHAEAAVAHLTHRAIAIEVDQNLRRPALRYREFSIELHFARWDLDTANETGRRRDRR